MVGSLPPPVGTLHAVLRLLVVLTVALVLAGSAAAALPRVVGIGEQKDGENSKAHVGDTLVVTLGANPAVGAWKLVGAVPRQLRLDSSAYVPAKHPPLVNGAHGIGVFIFKVAARGKATLKLNYVSSAAGHKVVRSFSTVVRVVAPGA
jgi:predicted secreted protein